MSKSGHQLYTCTVEERVRQTLYHAKLMNYKGINNLFKDPSNKKKATCTLSKKKQNIIALITQLFKLLAEKRQAYRPNFIRFGQKTLL